MTRVRKLIASAATVGLMLTGLAISRTEQAAAVSATSLYAVVNGDGTLARASAGTQSAHPGPGEYDIHFKHSVKGCQPVANLGYPGASEVFTFQGVTTVQTFSDHHTVAVTMTYPGDVVTGYPYQPVLRDNSFHLAVNCHHDPGATVSATGHGTGAGARHLGPGRYLVDFGQDISDCAPVATVATPFPGTTSVLQANIALGRTSDQITVQINDSQLDPVDATFYVIEACSDQHTVVASSSGFYNWLSVADSAHCALVGSWYQSTSQDPITQGFVSTWAISNSTVGIQTKNGGYGIELGFGVSLAAICG